MSEKALPHRHNNEDFSALLLKKCENIEDFGLVADIFKQLGDTSRVRIYWLLCHTEECVINISALLKMSSPAVSHHLRSLKACGLIVSRRDGKEVYYKASSTPASVLLHEAIEKMMEIACPKNS